MVQLSTIIGIFLSCYIPIAVCCRSSQTNPNDLGCFGAVSSMEYRTLTGTANDENYLYEIDHEELIFYVKASSNAEIILHTSSVLIPPLIKVIIGRHRNNQSVIEENEQNGERYGVAVETPNVLSEKYYRGFWIRFDELTVNVGKESEEEPFMRYDSPLVHNIYFISFSTPLVETAEWIIVSGIKQNNRKGWCERSKTINPRSNAVKVDVSEGKHVYVCRSRIYGDIVPGYAKSPNGGCKIEHHGSHKSKNYQLLLSDRTSWKTIKNHVIPVNAAVGGLTDEHEPLFICRFKLNDKRMIIGNTNNDGHYCWAASKGKRYHTPYYDILIHDYH